ncbi:MAG: ATP-binding cassette domain-containing protein, partial [Pseudomonadota bacterium]
MEVVFKNVTKRYGKTVAVGNLNLTVKSGALHFLLGPSGCGKTTTLRMLAGLESVTEGQI